MFSLEKEVIGFRASRSQPSSQQREELINSPNAPGSPVTLFCLPGSGILLCYLDSWDVMNISSSVDWPAEWKSRQNKKRAWIASHSQIPANEAFCTQSPESTHQWSCRQRMVSIKWNTTELLISLERIFLNYYKHPQHSLQWTSVFQANSNHSSVLGQSLPKELLSGNYGRLPP